MNIYLIIFLIVFIVFIIFWFVLLGRDLHKHSHKETHKKLHIQIDRDIHTIENPTVINNDINTVKKTNVTDNVRSAENVLIIDLKPIPTGYGIDNNKLPFKENRVYGWGKEFNTFVTSTGKYYHRSKCSKIKGKNKILMHRYSAMIKYSPCPCCKPKSYIDDWYIQNFPDSPFAAGNFTNTPYIGEQLKLFDK